MPTVMKTGLQFCHGSMESFQTPANFAINRFKMILYCEVLKKLHALRSGNSGVVAEVRL